MQLSGNEKNQQSLQELSNYFLKHVRYGSDFQAVEFEAGNYNDRRIIMNPRFLFGQPRVENAPCTAPTLWRAFVAEGTYEKVSKFYEVDEAAVIASVKYCQDVNLAA